MSELIECRGLRKSFRSGARRVDVLGGLDLVVERGEMVAIMGESGVGKSTLLHVLGLIAPADGGSYRLGGRDVARLESGERARIRNERLGFVFQFHHLLPELSVLENVAIPAMIGGEGRAAAARRAEPLLASLGLSAMMSQRPVELSGGEQQRVAVARALMTAGDLLLADEPTGNLDPATASIVFDAFQEAQRGRNLAAIVATHSGKLAKRCDRVLMLRDGMLAEVRPADLTGVEAGTATA
jgi:lipoprotein-releasing system ATP-binding protein